MTAKHSIRAVIWDTEGILQPDQRSNELVSFIRAMRPVYRTVLFCRTWEALQETLVHRWDMADAFDQLILAPSSSEYVKPQTYSLAAHQLNVRPRQAVLVDTFPERVASARSAGLQTVQFSDPAQAGSELLDLLKEDLM